MSALPALFVSHGSPMHALDPGAVGEVWRDVAARLPRPKAILMASAHWEADVPMLTGAAKPETIHDFYGFPQPLYRIQYRAPGDPDLAAKAKQLLKNAGIAAGIDGCRGLDHGAWSPLVHMYPEADIPVVQLSVQTPLGPRHHLELGRALAPLASEGVLVFGSGHMTHNLRDRRDAPPAPYVLEFQDWVDQRLANREDDRLADYRAQAPGAVRAHPSDEHFLPLFVALGAAKPGSKPERLYSAIETSALAMDAYLFQTA
mgnify:CR=1 FL=1